MKYSLLIIIAFGSIACGSVQDNAPQNPNGLWQQLGYGRIVEVSDSIIKVYDICEVDCHLAFEEEILDFGRIKEFSKDSLIIKHNIDDWKFYRIDELPDLCKDIPTDLNQDPIHNFETFWHTFNEHYCSFERKDIDWDKMYEEYQLKVSNETSELELYLLFEEMIALLEDAHVEMELPEAIEEEYTTSQTRAEKRYSNLDEFELHKELTEIYVDSLRNYNGGVVRWGMIGKEVGYIQFNTMWMMANHNIDPELSLMETYELYMKAAQNRMDEEDREDQAAGAAYIMEVILNDLSQAKSYILDLRFNGGGKDCVAMEIINGFSSNRQKVVSKYVWYKDSFTAHQNIYVEPSVTHFDSEVIILTSHFTASAAELTVLASLDHPNILRMGSNTEGIFSSTLDKTLPNGWSYELSNEIYEDLKGNNYEHIGIPADIEVEYALDKDMFLDQINKGLEVGKDEAIEIALSHIKDE